MIYIYSLQAHHKTTPIIIIKCKLNSNTDTIIEGLTSMNSDEMRIPRERG